MHFAQSPQATVLTSDEKAEYVKLYKAQAGEQCRRDMIGLDQGGDDGEVDSMSDVGRHT